MQASLQGALTKEDKIQAIRSTAASLYALLFPTQLYRAATALSERIELFSHLDSLFAYAEHYQLLDESMLGLRLRLIEFQLVARHDFDLGTQMVQRFNTLLEQNPALKGGGVAARAKIMEGYIANMRESNVPKNIALLEEAKAILLPKTGHPEELLLMYNQFAQAYYLVGDLTKAEEYAGKGREVIESYKHSLDNGTYLDDEAMSSLVLSRIFVDKNQLNLAETYVKKFIEISDSQHASLGTGGLPPSVLYLRRLPGELQYLLVLSKQKRHHEAYEKARLLYAGSLTAFEKGKPHLLQIELVMWEAYAALHLGKKEEARRLIDKLFAIEKQLSIKPDRYNVLAYPILAEIYAAEGQPEKAQQAYKQAESIYDELLKKKGIDEVSVLYQRLATGAFQSGNLPEARRYLQRHIDVFGPAHPRSIEIQETLVTAGKPQ